MLANLAEPLRVLLAEDNPTNQLVFAKLMQNFNVAVTIAENGREAVEQASHRTFDIVFMDMRMPEMDGLEAARAIRALGGDWARIPMIALTANAFADDVKACRDAGMDEFIAKPMRKKVLIEKLAMLLAGHPLLARPRQPAQRADEVDALPVTPPAEVAIADVVPLLDVAVLKCLTEEIEADGVRAALDVFLERHAGLSRAVAALVVHARPRPHQGRGASAQGRRGNLRPVPVRRSRQDARILRADHHAAGLRGAARPARCVFRALAQAGGRSGRDGARKLAALPRAERDAEPVPPHRAVAAGGERRRAHGDHGLPRRGQDLRHPGQPGRRLGRDRAHAGPAGAADRDDARVFVAVPGGWGERGWTRVRLAAADAATLKSALTMAWQNRAPKKLLAGRTRPASKAKTSRKK